MAELSIRAAETHEELHLANDLMAKAHLQNYFQAIRWMETEGVGYPGFQRAHTRIALLHGELAGALRLTSDIIRIGEARLRMGGFGWVTTADRHRHKGVARELMRETLHYMRGQNYHVSMLFGIPNFYHRFGFTTALSDYITSIDVFEAAAASGAHYKLRAGKPGDIAALQKIHAADDAEVACSLIRSAAHITNRWERWKHVRVLTDDRGKVEAYFLPNHKDDQLFIEEIGISTLEDCASILHACAAIATEACIPRIQFHAPPSHPFVRYISRFKSTHETRVARDSGGMLAFVNLGETLESMIPEWESLLVGTSLLQHRIEVTLVVDNKPHRIRANKGSVDIMEGAGSNKVGLTEAELIHLLTGYGYVDDVLQARPRILTAQAVQLARTIFPKRKPYVWIQDRF